MIKVEYIIDDDKSLLTIHFNRMVLYHLKAKTNDYVNFYQSKFNVNILTIFKSDSGYRILRNNGNYQIIVRKKLLEINEFENRECTYFLKKNGFIIIFINKRY